MRINPRSYKKIWNNDIIDRTKYALAGLLYLLLRERSIGNIAKMAAVVMALALWLQIDLVHGTLIFLSFALLWTVETLNSAIEAVVDLVTQEVHPMAKVAKDVAASATLVATITASITTLIFIIPPLWDKLKPLLL
jgi:diacylglycerol kinase